MSGKLCFKFAYCIVLASLIQNLASHVHIQPQMYLNSIIFEYFKDASAGLFQN